MSNYTSSQLIESFDKAYDTLDWESLCLTLTTRLGCTEADIYEANECFVEGMLENFKFESKHYQKFYDVNVTVEYIKYSIEETAKVILGIN